MRDRNSSDRPRPPKPPRPENTSSRSARRVPPPPPAPLPPQRRQEVSPVVVRDEPLRARAMRRLIERRPAYSPASGLSSPQTPPLPAPRPLRRPLDFGSPQRRALTPPAPPADWASPPPNSGEELDPLRLPSPPENLGDILRDLNETYSRPAPRGLRHSPERGLDAEAPVRPGAKEAAEGKRLHIPLICTQTDRPFILAFRETRSVFGTRYKHELTLTDIGEGSEAASSLTVPITSLEWGGIKCPHCRSECRPIHCGRCARLACDGRVTCDGEDIIFACAPSCGSVGRVQGGLKTVTGSAGRHSSPPTAANSFVCAPIAPSANLPRLPKPR
jgi:hypothetical protein